MAEVIRIAESALEPTPILPQNVEAEAALIGALMIDNRLVEDIQLKLKPHHFFEPLHGRIYESILRLTDSNRIANPVTLKPLFDADEGMKEVGGPAYLAQLTGSGAAVIGARDFAGQIYDLALLRALVGVGRELVEGALDTSEDVAPLAQIERAETELYKVAEEGGAEGKAKSFGEATKEALRIAEAALNSGGHLSGITTGLNGLNDKLGGLHPSDLIILAGRPGMGKTALATNIAFAAARRRMSDLEERHAPEKSSAGAAVAFFSLEMSADQLVTRILAEQSEIQADVIRTGRIKIPEFHKLARAAADLSTLQLYIDDTPGLTIAALRARARRLKRQKGIGMVVVDYLQLLQGTGKSSTDNRVNEISEISRGLKQLAKELSVPVLALSQLSRAVEQREDKRPQLSDLRESGSIEQDADIVLFVYREDYYVKFREVEMPAPEDAEKNPELRQKFEDWDKQFQAVKGKADVIIAKQRHGATGVVPLHFDSRITKFSDSANESRLPEIRS
jgi:replicative DNA helicase